MTARGGIRSVGGRSEPTVVLEALRHRFRRLVVSRLGIVLASLGQSDANLAKSADPSVANEFAGATEAVIGTLLAPGLEDHVRLVYRIAHRAPFGDRERERLLAIDVLLGLAGLDDR